MFRARRELYGRARKYNANAEPGREWSSSGIPLTKHTHTLTTKNETTLLNSYLHTSSCELEELPVAWHHHRECVHVTQTNGHLLNQLLDLCLAMTCVHVRKWLFCAFCMMCLITCSAVYSHAYEHTCTHCKTCVMEFGTKEERFQQQQQQAHTSLGNKMEKKIQ